MAKKVQLSANDRRKPPDARRVADFVAGKAAARERREKLHLYVDNDVATAFRLYCARERRELSDVASEALAAFLRAKGELGA